MNTSTEQPGISRRQLLRCGLLGTLVLATAGGIASVTRTLRSGPGTGYRQLRESHIPMLRRIIPVILDGALPAGEADATVQAVLDGLDRSLDHLSPAMRSQSLQLFDLLSLDLTRGAATGIWRSWENATSEQVANFLSRWEHSRLALFRQGYGALNQAILLVWYGQPLAWAHCGYPGPPRF
ncbi:hypothetical protein SAMN05216578_101369 [Halopseudomonas formosensis]|uniref:Twin-arginine translocation pathway signal protein n=1 Tax=Halopseudomonas formosensis TaxID=1002526 RepID=A0A1I5ZWG1_9GAMM|nr:twin-arginine translocation pathway signal protein [Halopseudomonas formosensis]SFQ60804.1 hypothetical protein SAMN05216578_101369 [Halopseudomonas formosensis]